jgi:hypothetical protein
VGNSSNGTRSSGNFGSLDSFYAENDANTQLGTSRMFNIPSYFDRFAASSTIWRAMNNVTEFPANSSSSPANNSSATAAPEPLKLSVAIFLPVVFRFQLISNLIFILLCILRYIAVLYGIRKALRRCSEDKIRYDGIWRPFLAQNEDLTSLQQTIDKIALRYSNYDRRAPLRDWLGAGWAACAGREHTHALGKEHMHPFRGILWGRHAIRQCNRKMIRKIKGLESKARGYVPFVEPLVRVIEGETVPGALDYWKPVTSIDQLYAQVCVHTVTVTCSVFCAFVLWLPECVLIVCVYVTIAVYLLYKFM